MIRVLETPRSENFTTLQKARVSAGLASTDTSRDEILEQLIAGISADIVAYTGRAFARARVEESLPGTGRTVMTLSLTPVMALEQVAFQNVPASGASIYDPEAGFIYNDGMIWTDMTPASSWLGSPSPGNQLGALDHSVRYIGGYLMPDDDLICSGTMTVSGAANAFLHSESDFPILVSGERIRVTGFSNAENNGRFTVLSRSAGEVIVAEPLVQEDAPVGTLTRMFTRTLPADLESIVLDELRERYLSLNRSSTLKGERLGDWSVTYETYGDGTDELRGFSPRVQNRVERWVRIV